MTAPATSNSPSTNDKIVLEQSARSRAFTQLKRIVQSAFTLLVAHRLLTYSIAQRLVGDRAFLAASESIARIPGLRGVYCRQAFYRRTLSACGQDMYPGWMSTFSMRQAEVAENVYIGRRCSIGFATIAAKVMLADGVQLLSGGREHGEGGAGDSHQDQPQTFERIKIGEGAWIGTNAIIMADVGAHAIVGAGAVVTKAVPDYGVAVGVPAKVVRMLNDK